MRLFHTVSPRTPVLDTFSRNTTHYGDSWHKTLEDALEQARAEFGVRPEEFRPA
jgi:hypothetical protein